LEPGFAPKPGPIIINQDANILAPAGPPGYYLLNEYLIAFKLTKIILFLIKK
jgi:hypothetical protein